MRRQDDVGILSSKIQSTKFNDARNTSKDVALLGPPLVEFAPYGRVPNGKPRKDARQGTIDQDPEFIDFLESLTNPITKGPSIDQETESSKEKEVVNTTPLIQFLKEKKANKGKEGSQPSKSTKHSRQDSKDNKTSKESGGKKQPASSGATPSKKRSAPASKAEQVVREVTTKLNEQVAAAKAAASPSSSSTGTKTATPKFAPDVTGNTVVTEKKRERGSASAAVKMLQRDLLGGGRPGRAGRAGNTSANKAQPTPTSQDTQNNSSSSTTSSRKASDQTAQEPVSTPNPVKIAPPPSEPAVAVKNESTAPKPAPVASAKSTPPPASTTQAFLKHANPSQGVTETLLEETFAKFGLVKKVEIDKKKGFAYVDFDTSDTLQKAIKASPVKVAQGQVVVLERKQSPSTQPRSSRGTGGNGHVTGNRSSANYTRGSNYRGRGGASRGGGANSTHGSKAKTSSSAASDPPVGSATLSAPPPPPPPTATVPPPAPLQSSTSAEGS